MYFKKDFIHEAIKKEFTEIYDAEFAMAYYQKTKDIEQVELGMVTCNHNGAACKKAIIRQTYMSDLDTQKMGYKFIEIAGAKSTLGNAHLINPDYRYKKDELTDVIFTRLNEEQFKKEFGPLNNEKVNEASSLMTHFCNLKDEGVIYSKEGEVFQYKIIENSDLTLTSYLLLDELRIYKDNIQVGYLKTKYTSDLIVQELLGKDYTIQKDKNLTPEHKMEYLKEKGIDHTELNHDIVFNLTKTQLQDNYKKIQRELKVFNDIATVDYSKISEQYKGRGLGTQMYFKIAQHYDNKNIMFRSSSLQSPSAKGLWAKIKKEYPSQIEEISIADQTYYKLKGSGQKDKSTHKRRNKKTL
jgi:hypothetical protein